MTSVMAFADTLPGTLIDVNTEGQKSGSRGFVRLAGQPLPFGRMLGRRVYGADNREWVVARRWLPWRPRKRGPFGDAVTGMDDIGMWFDLGDSPAGFLWTIIAGIVFLLFVVFVLPVVLTILEIVLVLVLLPLFVVARMVLRKPWIIVARTKGPPREQRTASASGWRGSRDAMEALIQDIRSHG